MSGCRFDTPYMGYCKKPADETGFCEEHKKVKCCSCGSQATHGCAYAGQFVCGAPLCDNCKGDNVRNKPSGAWGFLNHVHVPKVAQQ